MEDWLLEILFAISYPLQENCEEYHEEHEEIDIEDKIDSQVHNLQEDEECDEEYPSEHGESDIGHQVGDPENVTHTTEKFTKRPVPTLFIDICRSPIFSKSGVGTLLVELEEPIYPGGDRFFQLQTSLRMLLLLT